MPNRIVVSNLLAAAIVVALLPAISALAIDATRPAHVRMVVEDEQGRVLPGARVWMAARRPDGVQKPEIALELKTDDAGAIVAERSRPDNATRITWTEAVHVELDGYVPKRDWRTFFPGAQVELTITLETVRTTLIRLRGPRVEPLPRVDFAISYVKGETRYTEHGDPRFFVTDEQGERLWRHGKLEDGFSLSGRPDKEKLKDEPIVTVTYQEGELPFRARSLRGKLLCADGSVAAGWMVARKVRLTGAGGTIRGPMYNFMQVEDLVPIGSDGRFEVEAGLLVVISPDGMPLLYGLDPPTWPPGVRHVTLRLPDTRRVHRGVVVDEAGRPVAGLRIDVDSVDWDGQLWRFSTGKDAARYTLPLWSAKATDGTEVGEIRTDAQGNYAVPTYYGSTVKLRAHQRGWSLKDWGGLGTNKRNIWRRSKTVDFDRFKKVTLVFEDEQGQPIPDIHTSQVQAFSDGKQIHSRMDWGRDSRGLHMFIGQMADRLEFEAKDSKRKWTSKTVAVDVAGPEDRVIHVEFNETYRLHPLTGQVLDPENKPVKNVHVYLYAAVPRNPDRDGNDYLQLRTDTDEQGKFFFDAAPNACNIEIRRSRRKDAEGSLPGWTLPLAVNRKNRNVVIRLDRGGSVKVLLPAGMGDQARGIYLQREDATDETPGRHRNLYFERDLDRNQLLSDVLRPGWYRLTNYRLDLKEAFAALGTVRAEVKPGEETVIDLRELKTSKRLVPESRPKSWTTVVVKHEGRVVSGAEVAVYTEVARREDVARWLQEWRSDEAMVREAAITMLKYAGALAVDAIRAASGELDRDGLLEELGKVENDGLHRVAHDLSDDTGTVRCELETGRNCVAVVRVRGRMIGWRAFVANGRPVTVDLRQARCLVIRLRDTDPEIDRHRYEWARIRLEEPSGAGIRALMSALCHCRTSRQSGGWIRREAVFDHQYPMQTEGGPVWVMEDLPVGAVVTVALLELTTEDDDPKPRKSGRITIKVGSEAQIVEW